MKDDQSLFPDTSVELMARAMAKDIDNEVLDMLLAEEEAMGDGRSKGAHEGRKQLELDQACDALVSAVSFFRRQMTELPFSEELMTRMNERLMEAGLRVKQLESRRQRKQRGIHAFEKE